MSRHQEIRQLVAAEFAKAGLKPTEYGIQQATEECVHFEDEHGRDPVDQIHYIINQAIPDGEREGWIE